MNRMRLAFAAIWLGLAISAHPLSRMAFAEAAVVNPAQSLPSALSRPQVDLLQNVYRFTTLRLEPDRGPYSVAVADALNSNLVHLYRQGFGDTPLGAGAIKPNSDPRLQGRLLCSLLTDQDAASGEIVFLLRCEMGNQRFNATHKRSIGVVRSSALIPAVESVLRQQVMALGNMYAVARSSASE